jgi:hypothetical protein
VWHGTVCAEKVARRTDDLYRYSPFPSETPHTSRPGRRGRPWREPKPCALFDEASIRLPPDPSVLRTARSSIAHATSQGRAGCGLNAVCSDHGASLPLHLAALRCTSLRDSASPRAMRNLASSCDARQTGPALNTPLNSPLAPSLRGATEQSVGNTICIPRPCLAHASLSLTRALHIAYTSASAWACQEPPFKLRQQSNTPGCFTHHGRLLSSYLDAARSLWGREHVYSCVYSCARKATAGVRTLSAPSRPRTLCPLHTSDHPPAAAARAQLHVRQHHSAANTNAGAKKTRPSHPVASTHPYRRASARGITQAPF